MSKKITFDLRQLCRRNKDGSLSTQANRTRMLEQMGNQLHTMGYRGLRATSLKEKHVQALVDRWHSDQLSAGTMKNRMSVLRWWAEKIGKQNLIARDNAVYGIDDRQYVAKMSKACELAPDKLVQIKDPYLKVSLALQREFGLRREECMKFNPSYADQGTYIRLKPSWTKGGRAREIPVRTEAQRAILNQAHRLAGKGSMIPPDRLYIQQLRLYEKHTAAAGLSKLHGLRHEYAQRRYQEMTGWLAPVAGGPASRDLSGDQKEKDQVVRLLISEELGHSREQITAVYLGR